MLNQKSLNDLKISQQNTLILASSPGLQPSDQIIQKQSKLVGSLLSSKSKDQLYNLSTISKSNNTAFNSQTIQYNQNSSIRKILPSAPPYSVGQPQQMLQPLRIQNNDIRVETPKEGDNLVNLKELRFKQSLSAANQLHQNSGQIQSPVLQTFAQPQNHRLRPATNVNQNNNQSDLKQVNLAQINQAPRSYSRSRPDEDKELMSGQKLKQNPQSLDRKSQQNQGYSYSSRIDMKLNESDFTKFKDNFNIQKVLSPYQGLRMPQQQQLIEDKSDEINSLKHKRKHSKSDVQLQQDSMGTASSEVTDKFKNIKNLQKNSSSSRLYLPPAKDSKMFFSNMGNSNQIQNETTFQRKLNNLSRGSADNESQQIISNNLSQNLSKSQSAQSLLLKNKRNELQLYQCTNLNIVNEENENQLLSDSYQKADSKCKESTPDDQKLKFQPLASATATKFFDKRFIDRVQGVNQEQKSIDIENKSSVRLENVNNSIMSSYYTRPKQEKSLQFLKYSAISKAGRNARLQTKTNQDSYAVIKGFCGSQTNWYFGVFDGHGTYGHLASEYASKALSSRMSTLVYNQQHSYQGNGNQKFDVNRVKDLTDVSSLDEQNLRGIITNAYEWTNEQMGLQGFDVSYSGSTSVTLVVVKDSFIVANAGDSRCIVFRKSSPGEQQEAECLSRDHKPNLAGESERIISRNGRIDSFKDFNGNNIGPMRVWMKNEDIPGLAMSRSLGDAVAESLGVIPTPDIKFYQRQPDKDRAIVVCSDGVSEFLENEQIGQIIEPYYKNNDTEGACRKLVEEATNQWLKEESVIDDITAIVIFFH
ncbi:protein phosphatase 2c containing protein [Stylonychia lemnae]|uniref:Protein phosphatase 2c containing protein n=1 Tax=Stylonychia lemnae TaxID=5949 RepID=A0A078A7L8_STYLE|nr:protein phosphatase 2c containing protein [Stylonychia lemnae]|eukprot:CDW78250.1 protein phosphatase 2c containing protein [Stylonychia lemnae]